MAPFPSIGKQFPAQPTPKALRNTYDELRAAAITINRSRGQYIRQVQERDQLITKLETELTAYAKDAAIDMQERAQLLAILGKYKEVFSAMEHAGDELVGGVEEYDKGIRPFSGGMPIARLVNACRAFIRAWKAAKEINTTNQLEAGV